MSLSVKVARVASQGGVYGPNLSGGLLSGLKKIGGKVFRGAVNLATGNIGGAISQFLPGGSGGGMPVPARTPPIVAAPSTVVSRVMPGIGTAGVVVGATAAARAVGRAIGIPGGGGPGMSVMPAPVGARVPGFQGALQRALPGGASGYGTGCPSGYHPNKSSYWTASGYVEKGTKCVKNRRRNPLNPRALDRSISRINSAGKAVRALGFKPITTKQAAHGKARKRKK